MKISGLRSFVTRMGNRPRVVIRMETDTSIVGWAEVYNHGPDLAYPPLFDYILELLRGEDPRRSSISI